MNALPVKKKIKHVFWEIIFSRNNIYLNKYVGGEYHYSKKQSTLQSQWEYVLTQMVWFDMSILFKLSLWPGYQNTGWPGLAAPCQAQDWFGVCDAAWPLPGSAGRCCGSARRPLYRLLEGGHHHHHHASCYSTTYTTYVYLHLNLTTSVCSSIFYIYFMKLA